MTKPHPWVRTKDQTISDLHKATNAYQERYRNAEEHLRCIADLVGEPDDVGAAWESVAAIIADANDMKRILDQVRPLLEDEDAMHPVGCSTWIEAAGVVAEMIDDLDADDPRAPQYGVGG